MTSAQEFDYEALAQDAMRGLVRTVLQRVAKSGPPPPGDHHFYISFRTHHPGVAIAKRLVERYPDEMTIVLQHMFERLIVQDDRFEVTLRFDGIAERLTIPFAAIKGFFDPSVPFGLQFEATEQGQSLSDAKPVPEEKQSALAIVPSTTPVRGREAGESKPKRSARPRPAGEIKPGDAAAASHFSDIKPQSANKDTRPLETKTASKGKLRPLEAFDAKGPADEPAKPTAKVVELDAFRKK